MSAHMSALLAAVAGLVVCAAVPQLGVAVLVGVGRLLALAVRGLFIVLVAVVLLAGKGLRRGLQRRAQRTARTGVKAAAWWTVVFVALRGRRVELAAGEVTGSWVSAAEVEREVLERWVQANGWPAGGRLCCRAEPRAVRAA